MSGRTPGNTNRPALAGSGVTTGETMGDRLQVWADLEDRCGWETLVLGNGLSINIWSDFEYSHLFKRASLKPEAHQLFTDFDTQNFETVLEALWHAETTLAVLGQGTDPVTKLYENVQAGLFQAVQQVHVPWKLIDRSVLKHISDAVSWHRLVFTLNYDLLTYWAAMESGPTSNIRDFFWSNQNTFDIKNTILEAGCTGLLYLHGGVHLWQDSKSGLTGKWTNRSGGALLSSVEANFNKIPSRQPVLVSEGTSAQKKARIRRSDYLTYALQTLSNNTSDTVIFGASFGEQDKHISDAIDAGGKRRIAISIRPGTKAQNNAAIARYHSKFPDHELWFFDSTSHPLGDRSLTVRPDAPS
jgi:Domain of unknown function (DUF4917)